MPNLTAIEIDNARLDIQKAAEARAIIEHDAVQDERRERREQRKREVLALEQQAENNRQMVDGMRWNNRMGLLLDAAIKRIDDRTSTTGKVDIPKAVTEAMDTLAEIERRIAPPVAGALS